MLLAGRYRLVDELGRGGMGTVWHGRDELLGRDVAIKEIDADAPDRELVVGRSRREARLVARLNHPHVVALYDVVEQDGRPWIVMEYVPSRTLAQVVAQDGPLPVITVARIGLEVLSALTAAHAKGIVHRDVKPDNVLLTENGRAVLSDFGIAMSDDDSPLTKAGIVVGTPAYIAPERAMGTESDPRSDLWSLGVTLYMAVEGRSPFRRGSGVATLMAVLNGEPRPFTRAGALAPVITGLLHKQPARRWDAARTSSRLRELTAGEAEANTIAQAWRARTSGWFLGVDARLAAGAVAVMLAGGVLVGQLDPTQTAAPARTAVLSQQPAPTAEVPADRPETRQGGKAERVTVTAAVKQPQTRTIRPYTPPSDDGGGGGGGGGDHGKKGKKGKKKDKGK